jgi:hypothetical protein
VLGLDPCASADFAGNELEGAAQAAYGLASGAAQAQINPAGMIKDLYQACAAGIGQYAGDLLDGVAQCVDNLNPLARIRDQFLDSVRLALRGCLDESAQQFGKGLFNTYATAAAGKLEIPAGGAEGGAANAATARGSLRN